MRKLVLDSCALIALFKGEKGGMIVADLLADGKKGICDISMHRANLTEVFYDLYRARGLEASQALVHSIEKSCIKIIDTISQEMMYNAGRIKVDYKVSFADSFAIACAIGLGATLVTADRHEMSVLDEGQIVPI